MEARWVATLSDGSTAVEDSGLFEKRPAERTPWVRLCQHAAKNKLHVTSLRLNVNGRTIHLPRESMGRFAIIDNNIMPESYSLQYHVEKFMDGAQEESRFVDLTAHFEDFAVHYIHDVTDDTNSWIIVTRDDRPMAQTPVNRSKE